MADAVRSGNRLSIPGGCLASDNTWLEGNKQRHEVIIYVVSSVNPATSSSLGWKKLLRVVTQ
jgi:cell division FtsZ-interacting protein ZapD